MLKIRPLRPTLAISWTRPPRRPKSGHEDYSDHIWTQTTQMLQARPMWSILAISEAKLAMSAGRPEFCPCKRAWRPRPQASTNSSA